MVFARVWIERGNEELMFNRYGVSVLQYEKVLKVDGTGSCPIMSMYLMPLKGTHKGVKMANFKLYVIYHHILILLPIRRNRANFTELLG